MGYIITLVLLGGIIAFSIAFARGMMEQHMEDARQKMYNDAAKRRHLANSTREEA